LNRLCQLCRTYYDAVDLLNIGESIARTDILGKEETNLYVRVGLELAVGRVVGVKKNDRKQMW
jgi:hypothetical protein